MSGAAKRGRVLFMASQPYFSWRGSPIRLGFDVRAISENGYDVDFLTLPIGEDREIPGVRIVRAPNLFRAKKISIGPSPLKLAFDAIMFAQAFLMACRKDYDIFHGVEDCGPAALILAGIRGAKAVFEKHSDSGSYKSGALISMYNRVEKFVVRNADAVIGTGPGLAERASRLNRYGAAYHISDIPSSLAEPDAEGTAAASRELRQGGPGEIIATYVGSFAVYQGMDLLFASIPKAVSKCPNLRIVIIGSGDAEIERRKSEMAAAGCADKVSFIGTRDPDILPCYLAASDILLSPRIAGMNTPLKLLDYLKVSRAIAATDNQANRFILDESTAVLTPPDPDSFAAGVAALAADPALREKKAESCRRLVDEKYNFKVFKASLAKCYSDVLTREKK